MKSETDGDCESAESPHGNTDSDGHGRMKPVTKSKIPKIEDLWTNRRIERETRTQAKKQPAIPMGTQSGLQRTIPDPAQPGRNGRQIKPERKSEQSKSLQHSRRTSLFHVTLTPAHIRESSGLLKRPSFRLPRESLNRTDYHTSYHDERLPPGTLAVTHTGANDERYKIRVGHQHIELSKNGGAYKLSRNGEIYEFPSNDKPCQLWINGEDIKIKSDGETIELPRNGGQTKSKMTGEETKSETNDDGTKPRTTDGETKPRTNDEEIMPETTDEEIKLG